jgi:hypothetical protein
MAQATGLTAVHVNRVLKHMRELGLVEVAQKRARIDRHGLADLSCPMLDIFERRSPAFAPRAAATG